MRSVTSYFNLPLYQKNLARFWPIWAGYTLLWLFLLPFPFFSLLSQYDGDAARQTQALIARADELHYSLQAGVVLSASFGLGAAMAVFSYLCFNRSTCMMHALPLDRKGLFFTNYLSGLSFLLLPHLFVFLSTAAVETLYGCLNLSVLWSWLWVQSTTALFFYSFAVFCAMFTGNIMAFPAFYGILNGLAAGIYFLMDNVLREFLYGYTMMGAQWEQVITWLTPSVQLINSCEIYQSIYSEELNGYTTVVRDGIASPGTVLIYGAAGLVLAVLALWVYQIRHVESAGDVVAIPIVRPVFKVGVSICSGIALGIFTAALLGVYNDANTTIIVLITLWTVVGAFAAEMLLKKSFRVLGSWKSAGVLALGMCLLFTGLKLDWFGFESRIPVSQDITSITISNGFGGVPYDDAHYGSSIVLEDTQHIQSMLSFHQAILREKDRHDMPGDDYYSIRMDYTLTNGTVFSRNYRSIPIFMDELDTEGSVTQRANLWLQDREVVRKMYRFDTITPEWRLVEAYLDNNYWSDKFQQSPGDRLYLEQANTADLERLWQAVQTDFEEGTIGVRYLFDQSPERMAHTYISDLIFVFQTSVKRNSSAILQETTLVNGKAPAVSVAESEFRHKYLTITLTPEARHTLACLEEMGGPTPGSGLMTHREARQLEETDSF